MRLYIIAEDEEEYEDDDDYYRIIEGAEEVGVPMTMDDLLLALRQTGLDCDEISYNQPVIEGSPVPHGKYVLYKGGSEVVSGWVSDNIELASQYGIVKSIVYEYRGQTIDTWSTVNDWDGNPQLLPPGPSLRKVYEGGYILIR